MLDAPQEVAVLLTQKLARKYTSPDLDAMNSIAKAYKDRSLGNFNLVN